MKRCKVAAVLLLTVFLASGCGNREQTSPSGQNEEENTASVTEDTDSQGEVQDEQQPEESGEQTLSDDEQTDVNDESGNRDAESQSKELSEAVIYYIDDATAEPATETVAVSNENDIWKALQDKGILTDECELLSFEMNEDEKTIDLDFNSGLGDRVRSFGTTGENEIIGCLVNTYLDAYECDGIKLTEEGQTFETSSGADFDGYTGRIEF